MQSNNSLLDEFENLINRLYEASEDVSESEALFEVKMFIDKKRGELDNKEVICKLGLNDIVDINGAKIQITDTEFSLRPIEITRSGYRDNRGEAVIRGILI